MRSVKKNQVPKTGHYYKSVPNSLHLHRKPIIHISSVNIENIANLIGDGRAQKIANTQHLLHDLFILTKCMQLLFLKGHKGIGARLKPLALSLSLSNNNINNKRNTRSRYVYVFYLFILVYV